MTIKEARMSRYPAKAKYKKKIVMATPDFVGESARLTENGIFPESDIGS